MKPAFVLAIVACREQGEKGTLHAALERTKSELHDKEEQVGMVSQL